MSLHDVPFGKRLRYLRLMLASLMGHGGGFFIPYRYAASVNREAAISKPVADLLQAAEPACRAVISQIHDYIDDLAQIAPDAPAPAPRWGQDWFTGLDAASYYTMIRVQQPDRIVEIGSGHSTRFAAQAIRDGGLATQITAIDPAPRATITDALSGIVTWYRTTVEQLPAEQRPQLNPGDILFIDSSHILMPGSDVDHLFNDWLPTLPAGVLIHIHDIFLPQPYPDAWRWRGYNEQPLVSTLMTTGAYTVVFASAHTRQSLTNEISKIDQVAIKPSNALETSLWLRKN